MSSLWKRWQTTVNKKYMRPSPKIRKKIRKVLNPCKNILPVVFSYVTGYIKRISLPTLRHWCVEGSMTIEAALVLPLFCLFLMTMGSAMEMIRLHNNLEVALWDAGRKISIYGSLSADREDSENRSEAVAIAYTLIKAQIEEQLGREYLEDAPLDGGSDGLQSVGSQGVFHDKIGDTARLAHGVVKLAHGRDQLNKSQFLHKGTDSALLCLCLLRTSLA